MTNAFYCDRCGDVFAGPPHARVAVGGNEFDLGPECGQQFEDWWQGIDVGDEGDGKAKPTSTVDRE